MITNRRFGVLYTGVTNDLAQRVWEHREGLTPCFTQRYQLKRLVFAERHEDIETAIRRETGIKTWPRAWKLNLIETQNPQWDDMFDRLI